MVDISFGHRYNVLIYEECDEEKEYCSYTFHRELPVGVRQSKQTENWPRSCRLKEKDFRMLFCVGPDGSLPYKEAGRH